MSLKSTRQLVQAQFSCTQSLQSGHKRLEAISASSDVESQAQFVFQGKKRFDENSLAGSTSGFLP
jgi:hypothetical protein